MKNSNLTCKATNCIHNENGECAAGTITVQGVYATTPSSTECSTFVLEGGYTFDNFAGYSEDKQTKVENIKCTAIKCVYNENKKCYAKSVEIMAANEYCGTFKCDM